MSWCRTPLWGPWPDFPFSFLLPKNCFALRLSLRPLWRGDVCVICSAICQWSESRRTHNPTLLSHLRLLGSLSVASYDSQGLRCKYSHPPPHGDICIDILIVRDSLFPSIRHRPHRKRRVNSSFTVTYVRIAARTCLWSRWLPSI
jgi:hypothetical protein